MAVKANTVDGIVRHFGAHTPDAVAILAPGRLPLSYSGLVDQIAHIRRSLTAIGISRGDRIATMISDGPEAVTAFLGIASYACVAPFDPSSPKLELINRLTQIGANAIVVDSAKAILAREIAGELGLSVLVLSPRHDRPAGSFDLDILSNAASPRGTPKWDIDHAILMWTSGTTSTPKLVPLTHRNLITSVSNVARWFGLTSEDVGLNPMPKFHVHGLSNGLLAPLIVGGSVVCPPTFDPNAFFDQLAEFVPTWYTGGFYYHHAILARAAAHLEQIRNNRLRFIVSGSGPLSPHAQRQCAETFGAPVIVIYGMTEAAGIIAANPMPPRAAKPGTVGFSIGNELAIVDEWGKELRRGQSGEVVLRGPSIFEGYEGAPGANDDLFFGDWLRTGDQGYIDSEGYLTLTGRTKDLINRGGMMIAPAEVEQALLKHVAVSEAAVFPIPHPTLGEDLGAAVVLRASAETPSEHQLHAFLAKRLAPIKLPRQIIAVDAIPKSSTGKTERGRLSEELGFTSGRTNPPSAAAVYATTAIETTLAGLWANVLHLDMVGPEDDFLHLGGDSLQAIGLTNLVREVFGVELPIEFIFSENRTVRAMARAIVEVRHKKNA